VVIILVAAVASFHLISSTADDWQGKGPTVSWQRTGGIMGLTEKLTVAPDGRANYTSNQFGNAQLTFNRSMVEKLWGMVESINASQTYQAKSGAADFFWYTLTLTFSGSSTKTVQWVDAWASTETLPSQLLDMQSFMASLVQTART
jgi:hypothetical protein